MSDIIYHKKVVSGNVTEIYSYENGVKVGEQMPAGHNVKKDTEEITEEERRARDKQNLQRSLSRTIRNLRRSINANIGAWGDYFPKFMTLTFKQNIKDHKTANDEFKKFIQRLNYRVTGQKRAILKYTCVVERQKRGAIHYHVIFYNLPYTPFNELLEVWQNNSGQRGLRINAIKEIDNVGSYVTKYVSKEIQALKDGKNGKREKEKKIYFQSRGLKEPSEEKITEDEIKKVMKNLSKADKVFQSEFENDYVGKIKYTQIREVKKG